LFINKPLIATGLSLSMLFPTTVIPPFFNALLIDLDCERLVDVGLCRVLTSSRSLYKT
jgi:hypothetical protein